MNEALPTYLARLARDGAHEQAVIAAAEALAADPWRTIQVAGLLARCGVVVADRDLGLTASLRVVRAGSRASIATVEAGAPYPTLQHAGRTERGAYDTPKDMARRVVASAVASVEGTLRSGLDPACGTGTFLLAMHEAGVQEIYGSDVDDLALQIAAIAVPRAKLAHADALGDGPKHDLVVGNPPFVRPEHQDKALRLELRRRFPWLAGRFDLVVPFASVAVDRARSGGAVGLVLPAPMMIQPYAAALRRSWVLRHQIVELSGPYAFPGAAVNVVRLVMRVDRGPAPLPAFGIAPEELLRLDNAPLNPDLKPGDVALVERIRALSVPLGDLCLVDTGVVSHLPGGSRERLLFDEPGPGRVKYADAKDLFAGRHRYLDYQPEQMHRAKSPAMFEVPKIVVQRLRGDGVVRALLDTSGIYVGHTCTVVVPRPEVATVHLDRLLDLIRSPLVNGVIRIERGDRLDLYPRDVASFPVPTRWFADPSATLEDAWALDPRDVEDLLRFSRAAT